MGLSSPKIGFVVIGDPPFGEDGKNIAMQELKDAGFPRGSATLTLVEREVYREDSQAHQLSQMGITCPDVCRASATEWVWLYKVEAALYGWRFYRAWYYYLRVSARLSP